MEKEELTQEEKDLLIDVAKKMYKAATAMEDLHKNHKATLRKLPTDVFHSIFLMDTMRPFLGYVTMEIINKDDGKTDE